MKLYTSPGACSMADHIVLQWIGKPFEAQVVSRDQRQTPEYLKINPAGAVPSFREGGNDEQKSQRFSIGTYSRSSGPM